MQKKRKSNNKKDEEVDNDLPVYCVCRSTNADRFMIACDQCEEWYHGDCINVTPKQAEQIKTYYCPQCRCKNPMLEIDYKHTRGQRLKSARQNPSPSNSCNVYSDPKSPVRSAKSKRVASSISSSTDRGKKGANDDFNQCTPARDIRRQCPTDTKGASTTNNPIDITDSSSPNCVFSRSFWPKEQDFPGKRRACSPRSRQLDQSAGSADEDCGMCDHCRDHPKFGGPNRLRQKCRLRQSASMGSSRNKNLLNSSQGVGARRRKQQNVQGMQMDIPSPRIQSYVDFDDEQFEVPIHLSPRSYPDAPHSFLTHTAPVGSKVRRGDHRIFTNFNEFDSQATRSYGRILADDSIRTPTHSRTKSLMPNIYPINTTDPIDYVDDDSDGDIVLPPMAPCAGPACMLTAVPGEKYCSDLCKVKHNNSRAGVHSGISNVRSGVCNSVTRDTIPIPYNLSYPDHMYCRHHKVQNSHSNGSSSSQITSPSYRATNQPFDQFGFDQGFITTGLRPSRNHPNYHHYSHHHHYPAGSVMHRLNPRSSNQSNAHSLMVNSTNRLNHMDNQGHTVICNSAETAAFIDSISSVLQRGGGSGSVPVASHGPINAFTELGLDLVPNHSTPSTNHYLSPSSGLSGVGSCYPVSTHGDIVRSTDIHNINSVDELVPDVDDDDDEDIGHQVDQSHSHPVYGYYMMDYNDGDVSNSHTNPRMSQFSNSPAINDQLRLNSSLRSQSMNHRLMTNDVASDPSISFINSSRVLPIDTNFRHSNIVVSGGVSIANPTSLGDLNAIGSSSSINNSNNHTLSTYLPGSDEFYTINDSDDLEINWPQETVAG